MAYSKISLGDLPELANEIIHYFQNDFSMLHSCVLVNRLWCRIAIPLLWEDPFSIPTKNYNFIGICLRNLNDYDKTKLNEYGINNNLFQSNTLFNYSSFIKCLNTSKISYSIDKWILTCQNSTSNEQNSNFIIQQQQNNFGQCILPPIKNLSLNSNSQSLPSLSTLNLPGFNSRFKINEKKIIDNIELRMEIINFIYKSLFKIFIQNNVNLNTFEIILIRLKDHNYFNDIYEIISQNPFFIRDIKNLKFSFKFRNIKLTNIYLFLKFLYTNCISITNINFQFKKSEDSIIDTISSHIINSRQNLKKILLDFDSLPLYNSLLSTLRLSINCSNTLNTITFYHIDFKNILIFKEIFERLNVLESIHIIDCHSLNFDFIENIVNINKPIKLRSLFINEMLQIKCFQLLFQKSGDYLENIGFGNHSLKKSLIELIIKYCTKIKFFELPGFDYNNFQNIYLILDLIRNFGQNLNYLTIGYDPISSIVLQNLGQILPFRLEYLKLSFIINNLNDFESFLLNSQNTFINKLVIRNEIQIGGHDILPYIKKYIMEKRRIRYLAFKITFLNGNFKDLSSLIDEVKLFKLYGIKVYNYDVLNLQIYDYIKDVYLD
ncbi:uncharacterized protein OCT59_000231 [Rhizophagus irregularis]|uniref:F-box domain-containing protein n=1 Tax=Rhizophagus irregularis (strain DAOM 181602 / DAOM 197198 / MUCL 43194) TaxID=747089 RepID=A0A2H5U4M6_RHIID|nr:hypothetical protein GLOIN_2v1774280 [Rhizophagus irregularis DAOM 181602=DAOM 197198]POG71896.1 hypothetical protein GLOIN_2v1774280 [Rhizophagus irregularis DAOM 181602=DAOM 197198]UZN98948.1 hypothetical protein OCT59_000231 [Rhizophagus irregularis]GBC49789.1 hypothetical protein GLOIN_2v1774280 [Rhizophagus irregularis DAOM 181602=DAOM 197198]|eukprot:XP_025178762.1 hypothetical protein GLOIN_2v1774280 [Rhizophagus irregularis DAOM 181602=DAOM 197198]